MANDSPRMALPTAPWQAKRADEGYGEGDLPNWRGVDWLAELKQVRIDGSRVNYVDMGSGEGTPVVLVHGLAGQWQNWLENIPRIAQERRVIALDLPGHGCSAPLPAAPTLAPYADAVAAVLEQGQAGPAPLVGHSLGGVIALRAAIHEPAAVSALVLAGAAGIGSS
ncbi:MAG TPA: alpha/beta fold hydrolase, partial [Solirubrobacterales bacterium]|nr:alpha/beta fold hydrolase [Solirubrobacterales bacterium]